MNRLNIPGYEKFSVLYVVAAALLLTILLDKKATHPGLVLGLVAIILGFQLARRAIYARPSALVPILIALVFVEIVAIVVVIIGWDPRESWISTWLALCSIGLMIDDVFRGRRKRTSDEVWW